MLPTGTGIILAGASSCPWLGWAKILKEINAFLAVVVSFIRYLLANTNELITRLQILIIKLEACDHTKDSDVLQELKNTVTDLQNLEEQLAIYITAIDTRTNSNESSFGDYTIRVIDEEVVDQSIQNKRRRGIALDKNGAIVVQSDLTFATNTTVIIEEVKQKLVSSGLVQPALGALTTDQAAIIAESLGYLEDTDIPDEDLSLDMYDLDSPENEDEDSGLGLNAFINKLKGGKRLRRRTKRALAEQKQQLAKSVANADPSGKYTSRTVSKLNRSAILDKIEAEKANIKILQEEIALLAVTAINPVSAAIIYKKTKQIKDTQQLIKELQKQL